MNQSTNIKLTAEISATSKGLVDALNQASSAVNSTSESWKSRFDKLKDSTSVMSQAVRNLGEAMKRVDTQGDMSHLSSSLGEVQTVFSKVQAEVSAFSQQMVSLKNSASELGMPVEEYQQFAEAVRQAGMSMEDGERMIKAMQERIQDFVNGVPEAVAQFDKFGISVERVSSNRATSNFREIAQAINETIPPTERATQCMDLFRASVDRTNAVSDQFNKVISNQDKDFVSEKDVQSAIGLEGAIERLGEQLGKYVGEIKDAGNGTYDFAKKTAELTDLVDMNKKFIELIVNALEKYNQSLEVTKNKTSTVGDAYKSLVGDVERAKEALAFNDEGAIDYGFDDILDEITEFAVHLQEEVGIVRDIMTQRINAGVPIDTTEMDEALDRIHQLTQAMTDMEDVFNNLGDTGNAELMKDFIPQVKDLEDVLVGLGETASTLNLEYSIEEAKNQFDELKKKFDEVKQDMEKGTRVEFDTKELDELLQKLEEFKKKQFLDGKSFNLREELGRGLDELKKEVTQYNAEVRKGYPIWQPIVNAVKSVGNGIRDMVRSGRTFGQTLRSWGTYMTHFKNTSAQANGQLKNAGAFLGKSVMQIMGMGSAVAVVAKAWQNVVALVKEYVNQLHEAEKAELYGNAGAGADDMTRVREKQDSKLDNMMNKLKEFADLYDAERVGGGEEARAKRINAQEQLRKSYGFEFKETDGAIEDLDGQIATQLDKLQKKRLEAIDAQIKANDKVRDGVDEYIKSFGGFFGYWKQLGHTFTGDVNGARAISEAQERSTRASDENIALAESRNALKNANLTGQWQRIRQGKAEDENGKAQGELLKRLREARENLEKWANSLHDTEHLKNLREIMDKYEDALKKGALSEEARKVAIDAVAKMLQKESEDEQKKHDEMKKAMDERIKQYKDEFKAYADAQRAVVEAQKDYARTQKDLANEAKAERIQKRRERLQRAMSRFGFQTYEGFNLNEKPSETRERRRNAQLDASISEKMAKSQSGQRVHFTHAEKERISQFETLQKKDKQLEASQKAMEAADKQLKAAEQLQDAAKAVRNAVEGRGETFKNMGSAIGDMLANSLPRMSRRRGKRKEATELFDNAHEVLNATGVEGEYHTSNLDYSKQLGQIHTDLQNIQKNVFVVR